MDLQEKINKAVALKKQGKLVEALGVYDDVYNMLVREATKRANSIKGTTIDDGKTSTIMPKFFNEADKHLKRDKTACIVANNMGTIFAELGDFENAKKMFTDAINLTPKDFEYKDPHTALEQLK